MMTGLFGLVTERGRTFCALSFKPFWLHSQQPGQVAAVGDCIDARFIYSQMMNCVSLRGRREAWYWRVFVHPALVSS